ncbi:MAG: AN1-type zinc finger protein [Candidatus Hodarchaeota archaeon]
MTYCEFCGVQITYLPFNCKYCGGTFCKKHRLPENHECTFELKHVPLVPISKRENKQRYQDTTIKRPVSKVYLDKEPKAFRKYLKRQEKQNERTLRLYEKPYKKQSPYQGTKILFFTIIIFSIIALFFSSYGIPEYLSLSLHGLVYKFTYYTFITSLFVGTDDPLSLLFLVIMLLILYLMVRNIEASKGPKFLIVLYIFSCFFTAIFYFLLRVLLIPIYSLDTYPILYIGLAWGGILGLLSYSHFPIMTRKITAFMYFLPIRMSGRSFLIFIIILRLLPVILFAWYDPVVIVFYLPELGGVLGAYILYKYQFNLR